MTDVKAAVGRVREELRVFDDESIDRDPLPSFEDLRTLLAHLDGEAERLAKARAEERALIVDALRKRAWLMGNAHTRAALLLAAGRIEDRKHLPREAR